jgi:hypothetical protein
MAEILPSLRRAWTTDSQNQTYNRNPLVRAAKPGTYKGETEYGFHDLGSATTGRLRVAPYAVGQPGQRFHMSVVLWYLTEGRETQLNWVGFPAADFECHLGNAHGPAPEKQGQHTVRHLTEQHHMACGVVVLLGSLGFGQNAGDIVTYGARYAAPSMVLLDVRGANVVQFDFARIPGQDNIAMNAFWGRDR